MLLGAAIQLTTLAADSTDALWRSATPEAEDLSTAGTEALQSELAARGTKALLVIRHDAIVCEWYAPDHAAETPHYTASLAKAIVGGLSLAVALSDGRPALDVPEPIARQGRIVSQSTPLQRQCGSLTPIDYSGAVPEPAQAGVALGLLAPGAAGVRRMRQMAKA